MKKNQMKLVKELMEMDLRNNEFSVWSKDNEETGETEYTFSLRYSVPGEEGWERIENIGGDFEEDYSEEYIKCKIFGW